MELDDNLKQLMNDLSGTIKKALSDSPEINEAIQGIKHAGYDVFLVLEATIGLNHRLDGEDSRDASEYLRGDEVQLKMNAQDMKFLKSLKIRVDDLEA